MIKGERLSVTETSLLAAIGGGEVDRNSFARPLVARVADGGEDALFALAHGGIGQADDGKGGQRAVGVYFDVDGVGVDAEGGG